MHEGCERSVRVGSAEFASEGLPSALAAAIVETSARLAQGGVVSVVVEHAGGAEVKPLIRCVACKVV